MDSGLSRALDRWEKAGLISRDLVRTLRAAEASRVDPAATPDAGSGTPAPITRRLALFAEVLGSLGAIAAGAAAVVGTTVLWPDLTTTARVAIPAMGTILLLASGAVLPHGGDGTTQRLGALMWLLSLASLAATVAILATDVLALAGQNVALVSGAAPLTLSLALLWRFPSPHLILATVGSGVCVAVGIVLQYDEARVEHVGAVLLCLGGAVVLLGWAELLPETTTGILAGAFVSLGGAEMLGEIARHWPIIAAGTLGGCLLGLFVASRDRACLVSGLIAALVAIVQGIVQLTRDEQVDGDANQWVVFTVFALGVAILTVSLVALRAAARSPFRGGSSR